MEGVHIENSQNENSYRKYKIKNGCAGNYDLAMIYNFSQKCN